MNQKLCLSENDKKIAGVCGGIAESFGFEPALVRIIWVLLTFLLHLLPIIIYVVLWAVLPKSSCL